MHGLQGTRAWVYSLGYQVEQPYRSWTIDGQVAGFVVHFKEGLTFATVKGAGHMVPQTSPSVALHLLRRYLNDLLW
ncbi:carboxypeptidase [Haematococcus lacustris]|uniref:Carboxypeptidase n=1 Tax=Haematococcus lacustris TaxID=44745 RepID=A0A699YQV1_HAELA|nr:carboxypeptidase [Haematococcus lacustris]